MTNDLTIQPQRGTVWGLTHDPATRAPIMRTVRTVKVGIGVPKGKDIHVYIDATGQWCVAVGKEVKRFQPDQDAEVRKYYREAKKSAPERDFPRRLPYFTFTHPGIDGGFDHALDMIKAHGPTPAEIPIVFDENDPFTVAYQWYSASGLMCSGDGITARRKVDLASGDAEKELAAKCVYAGMRTFPIIDGCAMRGCPYASGDKPQCRPHGRLVFQLQRAMRMGGSAQFDTVGKRSISQLFSGIERFKQATGHGDAAAGWIVGIPLFLVVRPYNTKTKDGKPTVQNGVYLEYRGESVQQMRRELLQIAHDFQEAAGIQPQPQAPQLPTSSPVSVAALEAAGVDVTEESIELAEAAMMDSEFIGDLPEHDEEETRLQMPRRKSGGTNVES